VVVKIIKISRLFNPETNQSVPFLRLSGKYLRNAGFESGEQIVVEIEPGKITIRPLIMAVKEPTKQFTLFE
jgi:hypothetical protein